MAPAMLTPEYILPNEPTEWERLDFQHRLLVRMFGGLYRAPLDPAKVHRVLDVGCGTGQWALDMAKQFPDAEVIGFDIIEKPSWKTAPANCSFRVGDLALSETWDTLGNFDFIHTRFISPSVKDWPGLVTKCYEHLNPGGYLECQDLPMKMCCMEEDADPDEHKVLQWGSYTQEAWRRCGLEPNQDKFLPGQLKERGFEDITMEDFKMFLGDWPEDAEDKETGILWLQNHLRGIRGFITTIYIKYLGWTEEELETFIRGFEEEMKQPKLKTFMPVWVCHARKPR